MIIDAWAQHPTVRFFQDPVFASLLRWTKRNVPSERVPVSATIRAMDAAGVQRSLISAGMRREFSVLESDAGRAGQPVRSSGTTAVTISEGNVNWLTYSRRTCSNPHSSTKACSDTLRQPPSNAGFKR